MQSRFASATQVNKSTAAPAEPSYGFLAEFDIKRRLALPVAVFLIFLVIPFVIQIGPLRLSMYRFVLLIMILPLMAMWLSGKAGRIRFPDIALLLTCLWTTLSFTVIHGPTVGIEAGAITTVETMGAYLLGRLYVRTLDNFFKVSRLLFYIILIILPFSLYESVSGKSVALDIFRTIYQSYDTIYHEERWGLRRAQSVFEHPILFGVFCSSIFGITFFVQGYGKSFFHQVMRVIPVGFTAILSLSSGPLVAMGTQIVLITWDKALRNVRQRWYILSGMFLSAVVAIEIIAERSPIQILISFVAFNKSSAWNRLRIWDYGTASVANHPLFGVGRNEWERPRFMTSSIDMFWLQPAVRNGLPSAVFLQAAFISVFLIVLFHKPLGPRYASYRTGYLISLLGLYLAGWTVHYWNNVYVLYVFLLGCGFCFIETPAETGQTSEPYKSTNKETKRKHSSYAQLDEQNELDRVSPYTRQKSYIRRTQKYLE